MPRYGAKSYAARRASCKTRPHKLPDNLGPPWRMFMERLDRAAGLTRQLALRVHCGAEARQAWGQDPVIGGDGAAAPAEIVNLADPGEVPLDDTIVGRRLRGACDKKCHRGAQQSKMPMLHSCSPVVIQSGLPRAAGSQR